MKIFRTPKTLNEMRASADPEIAPLVRKSRASHNLPNSWDDRPFSRKYKESEKKVIRSRRGFRTTIRRMVTDDL